MKAAAAGFLSHALPTVGREREWLTHWQEAVQNAVSLRTGEAFQLVSSELRTGGELDLSATATKINAARVFVALLSPSYFKSERCRTELQLFGGADGSGGARLLLPVYYLEVPGISKRGAEVDWMVEIVMRRQFIDWRDLRFEAWSSPTVRRAIDEVARIIAEALGVSNSVAEEAEPTETATAEEEAPPAQKQMPAQKQRAPDPPAATPPAPPPPASAPRFVESRLGNDAPAQEDKLDRIRLVRVLAEFLRHEGTRTPLTLSIEGRWGSGKTSFMRLLDRELTTPGAARADGRRPRTFPTIWFNPWRHQNHEELWAAFALAMLDQLPRRLPWWRRVWGNLKLQLNVPVFVANVLRVGLTVAGLIVVFMILQQFAVAGKNPDDAVKIMSRLEFWTDFTGWNPATLTSLYAAVQVAYWLWGRVDRSLLRGLERHVAGPDYRARTSFLEAFHTDFARTVRAFVGAEPIVVFIDDLDRCDVPRAAELMQGINLMIGEHAPIIFIFGIDRTKVAAGLAVKHSELLPFLYARELAAIERRRETQELRTRGLEYGYEFIEKFIQLPFRLPPSSDDELRGFIRSRLAQPGDKPKPPRAPPLWSTPNEQFSTSRPNPMRVGVDVNVSSAGNAAPTASAATPLATGTPGASERTSVLDADETHLAEPLLHAARVLDGNPRRIGQMINLVRLQRLLAPVLNVEVTDGQLAKWTAVALRWPVFVIELEMERELLEQLVMAGDPPAPSPRYERWNRERDLVEFLRDEGPPIAGDSFDLTLPGVVQQLLRLGVTIPVAEAGAVSGSVLPPVPNAPASAVAPS